MTVEELYAQIGGNYQEVIGRLRSDRLVSRFIGKLADDGSAEALVTSWRAGDEQATFEAAHTVKGVCGNLALTELAELSSSVTEALRPGNEGQRAATDVDALVGRFAALWERTVGAIRAFSAD